MHIHRVEEEQRTVVRQRVNGMYRSANAIGLSRVYPQQEPRRDEAVERASRSKPHLLRHLSFDNEDHFSFSQPTQIDDGLRRAFLSDASTFRSLPRGSSVRQPLVTAHE